MAVVDVATDGVAILQVTTYLARRMEHGASLVVGTCSLCNPVFVSSAVVRGVYAIMRPLSSGMEKTRALRGEGPWVSRTDSQVGFDEV
jgi:hypothetical protein